MKHRTLAFCIVSVAINAYAIDQVSLDSWSLFIRQADMFQSQGRFAEAERAGRLALTAANVPTASDERLPVTHAVLASIYREEGRCGEARSHYLRAATLYESQVHPNPKYVFSAIVGLIGEACECDDFTSALKLFRLYEPKLHRYRSDLVDDAKVLALQAGLSRGQKHYAAAEQQFRDSIALLEQSSGARQEDIAELRSNLGLMIGQQGRAREGIKELELAISQLETVNSHHATLPAALNNMGTLLIQIGSTKDASRVFHRALTLAVELYGEENRKTAMIMLNYAAALRGNNEDTTAAALQAKAQNAYRRATIRDTQIVDIKELEATRRTP